MAADWRKLAMLAFGQKADTTVAPVNIDDNGNVIVVGNVSIDSSIPESSQTIVVRNLDSETLTASGSYSDRFIINKFGRNPDVDSATAPEDIWDAGGLYTGFPTTGSAEVLRLTSDSANDAAAGTGARTVTVFGLDGNYAQISETVTLNGTTPVTTTNTFWRVYRTYAATAGSNGTNVGNITVQHNVTTANVFAYILAGTGQAHNSNYTVPAGYTAYMRNYNGSMNSTATNQAEIAIYNRPYQSAYRIAYNFVMSNTSGLSRQPYGGLTFAEKTDLCFRALVASANNLDLTVSYSLLLVKN